MKSVLTKLSNHAYKRMRTAMVNEVYNSKTMTIADIAARHKVSHTTLWGWCHEDLGPNQIKWLLQKSKNLRSQRIAQAHSGRADKNLNKEIKEIMTVKNKPWSKKKSQTSNVKVLEIVRDPNFRKTIHSANKPTPTVIVNIDHDGKFLKYEVTGSASVQVFTRNK